MKNSKAQKTNLDSIQDDPKFMAEVISLAERWAAKHPNGGTPIDPFEGLRVNHAKGLSPMWRDAVRVGDFATPEMVTLMAQQVIAGRALVETGKHMWGGGWTQITSTWEQAIDGFLSLHPEQADKGGDGFFFAESELTGEIKSAFGKPGVPFCYKTKGKIRAMYAVMIDVDGGCTAEAVVENLRKAGIAAVIYTTHSNSAKGGPGSDRFRVIVLLDKPFAMRPGGNPARPDWGPDYPEWQALYAGVCDLIIPAGANVDSTGFTPTQLMYTPARPVGAGYKHYVVAGRGLDLSTVTHGDPKKYEAPTTRATGGTGGGGGYSGEPAFLADRFNLNSWFGENQERFLLSSFLDHAGWTVHGESGGGYIITCPNAGEHSSDSNDAWVIDGPDAHTSGAISCRHDHCRGLHTADFLKMIADQIAGLPDQWPSLSHMLCDEVFYADGAEPVNRDDYIPAPEPVVEWLDTPKQVAKAFAALTDKSTKDAFAAIWAGVLWAKSVAGAVSKFDELLLTQPQYSKVKDRDSVKAAGMVMGTAKRKAHAEEVRGRAEREEVDKRKHAVRPDYVALEQATAETVIAAAQVAPWLPHFVRYSNGWFEAQAMDSAASKWKRLCRAFEVPFIAFGENAAGRSTDITIRYQHRSTQRGIVESVYKIGDTFKEPGAFLSRLADAGLELDGMADTAALVRLFKSVNTSAEALLVDKAGWHENVYIAPTGEAMNAGKQRYILNPAMRVNTAKQGTLADHHRHATTALSGTNGRYFMPGYLSGFVGCVLDYIENETSIIIAAEGVSTRGKTTCSKAGAAHWAKPDESGLFHKADVTPTAAENLALKGNASMVGLDDDGASKDSAEEKQRRTLQMGDNSGRGRGTPNSGNQETKTWRTCFVTSTEVGFLNRMLAEDADVKTGAVSRVFSVNFDGAAVLKSDSDELAALRALANTDTATGVYGVTGPLFAAALAEIGRDAVKARITKLETEWQALAKGAGARVVRNCAIITLAGEIAQNAGIFGLLTQATEVEGEREDVSVKEIMHGLLVDTLEARTAHLNTDQQAADTLRRTILRGIQTGAIEDSHNPPDHRRGEVLGYFGHYGSNGQADDAIKRKFSDTDDEMRARVYVLPIDRLAKLGNTTDPKSLADWLKKAGALIGRKKGEAMQWWHDYVPGEGSGNKNIKVTGLFVHGAAEIEAEAAPPVSNVVDPDNKVVPMKRAS